MNENTDNLFFQCKELIKYGATMANLSLKKMKEEKNENKDIIEKLDELVKNLSIMNDDLEMLKEKENQVDVDNIEYLETALAVGGRL